MTLQTEELTPNHVRLAANILLAACQFADHMGVDPDKVDAHRKREYFSEQSKASLHL